MRSIAVAMAMPVALGVLFTTACGKSGSEEKAPLVQMSVEEAEVAFQKNTARAVDANSEQTRGRMGVVTSAVLLSDPETFAASELPSQKDLQLVFYCGGEHCTASHTAARRARDFGYGNVRVMGAGIAGWVKAGKPVTKATM